MRDQGSTLLSHPSEKKTPSLKVRPKEENMDGIRQALGTSYGPSKLISSVPVLGSNRLKGGSMTIPNGITHSGLPDYANLEKVKNSFPIQRLQRCKPLVCGDQGLPQWGAGKRSRGKTAKHAAAAMADQSVGKSEKYHHSWPSSVQQNAFAPQNVGVHVPVRHGSTVSAGKKESTMFRNGTMNGCRSRWSSEVQASSGMCGRGRDRARPPKIAHGLKARHQDEEKSIPCAMARNNQLSGEHHRNGSSAATAPSEGTTVLVCSKHSQPQPLQQKAQPDALEWVRISLTLSRKEKEEDFCAIKSCKLPQRPKKRLKVVERIVQYITPGNLLMDMAQGRYDIRAKKCNKKVWSETERERVWALSSMWACAETRGPESNGGRGVGFRLRSRVALFMLVAGRPSHRVRRVAAWTWLSSVLTARPRWWLIWLAWLGV